MTEKINTGWTDEGALSTINWPQNDAVYPVDPQVTKRAWAFLKETYTNDEIERLLAWKNDQSKGRPLR